MRIGILTLPLHTNYGGILQAYALQTALQRMGHNVCVFDTKKTQKAPLSPVVYAKRLGYKLLKDRSALIMQEKHHNRVFPIIAQHTQRFASKYINKYTVDSLSKVDKNDFDAIVVGSDQIWRPKYFSGPFNARTEDAFLAFTEGWNIKRIAYAASFGVDHWEFTAKETVKCKAAVACFDAVAVREDAAVVQCKEHFGVEAKHVVDPTMLLNKEDYIALIEQENEPVSKGTLFKYILDETPEKQALVNKVAKELGLQPFAVKPGDKGKPEERIYPPITAWLRAFLDAEFIVCDSFHGAVFSIIFNKPFIVIGNKKRGMSRFTSLLKMFSLEERMVTDFNNIDICKKSVDWETVNATRSQLQTECLAFLNTNLS